MTKPELTYVEQSLLQLRAEQRKAQAAHDAATDALRDAVAESCLSGPELASLFNVSRSEGYNKLNAAVKGYRRKYGKEAIYGRYAKKDATVQPAAEVVELTTESITETAEVPAHLARQAAFYAVLG
jgi:hypothetical protein